jgi:segregation and condensation protein A
LYLTVPTGWFSQKNRIVNKVGVHTASEEAGSGLYNVNLDVFEGPLDVLLHLIRQQEIDIYDIPIAKVTEQYLTFLQMMKDLDIDLAADYLVMAATLIYIKSQMLLPTDPAIDECSDELDPRLELVEQLLEHEKFKNAAQMLFSREIVELSVWPRGEKEFEDEESEAVSASVFDLVQAFHVMVERFKEQIVLDIEHEPVTMEEKLAEIRRMLMVQSEVLFSYFFEHKLTRRHLVVTLAALLELVRLQEVKLLQKGVFEDIRIVAC